MSKVTKIDILYDNGKHYHVTGIVSTNAKELAFPRYGIYLDFEIRASGEVVSRKQRLEYTKASSSSSIEVEYKIDLDDIAGLTLYFDNGDIVFKKLKSCACAKVESKKRYV